MFFMLIFLTYSVFSSVKMPTYSVFSSAKMPTYSKKKTTCWMNSFFIPHRYRHIFIPNQWANLRLAATKTMPHNAKSRNSMTLVLSHMLHTPYAE